MIRPGRRAWSVFQRGSIFAAIGLALTLAGCQGLGDPVPGRSGGGGLLPLGLGDKTRSRAFKSEVDADAFPDAPSKGGF